MAFSQISQYSGADLFKTLYGNRFVDGVFRNNAIYDIFGEPQGPYTPDKTIRWHVASAANGSVEVFTEDQAQPAPGAQTYIDANLGYTYFRGMLRITGHLQDVMRNGGAWEPIVDREFTLLIEDIRDLVTTTFLGATQGGIQAAVDSTTTYAGVTRGSQTAFESTETATNDVLGYDNMMTHYVTMRDASIGAMPDMILMSWTQAKKYHAITGQPAVKNQVGTDVATGFTGMEFNTVPILAVPDLTNTIAMWLTRASWAMHSYRSFEVKDMAPAGDSDVFQISTAPQIVCFDPKMQGKQTGLTT